MRDPRYLRALPYAYALRLNPHPLPACRNGHGHGRRWSEVTASYVCLHCGDYITMQQIYQERRP